MQYVRYEKKDGIGEITIDRPEALNALSAEVLEELMQALDTAQEDLPRCLIVTGGGEKAFVAGADISQMRPLSRDEAAAWSRKGNAVFRRLEQFPCPVIAAVNGYALGGGCELALACDIRLASENAVFAQPEVTLGITAGFGGTQRLPRLIGAGKALEMLLSAGRVKADQALSIGLVNAVYPAEQLMESCRKLAGRIAAAAPLAVRATKKAVQQVLQTHLDAGLELEASLFGDCFETLDQQNAMAAFVEKRKPEPFEGR